MQYQHDHTNDSNNVYPNLDHPGLHLTRSTPTCHRVSSNLDYIHISRRLSVCMFSFPHVVSKKRKLLKRPATHLPFPCHRVLPVVRMSILLTSPFGPSLGHVDPTSTPNFPNPLLSSLVSPPGAIHPLNRLVGPSPYHRLPSRSGQLVPLS